MRADSPNRSTAFVRRFLPVLTALALCNGTLTAQVSEGDITAGVWAGTVGADVFYWELWREGSGLSGVVHWVSDGKKESEIPVDRIVWEAPGLELHMDATGVTYRGTVDFSEGRIDGQLFYGAEAGPEMELHQTDPDQVTSLRARSPDAPDYAYSQPESLADGWVTADCQEVGLTHAAVAGLVNAIEAGDAGVIHSLLLVVDGQLVVEEYFHGYERDDRHRLASVTKSVSSLLVGLAIDQGMVSGVDAPVLSFFPALEQPADDRWPAETLHHLLTMSMGLDWGARDGAHGTGPEFFQRVLARRVVHDPGTHWAYHSANVNLLAGVIKQASGQHADVFAEEHLFGPLGITDYDWSFMAEEGYRLMDGSLYLRPRDMAKLGALLSDEGRWLDRQVISADWIRQSVTPHIATDGSGKYGYLWWLGEFPGWDGLELLVLANGHGSQFIAWSPGRDMILVVTGGNEDNGKHFAIMEVVGRHF